MAHAEREVAEIARVITDKPYTWREEDGRLVIVTRDAEFEVVDSAPANGKAEAAEPKDARPAKRAAKGTGSASKGKRVAPGPAGKAPPAAKSAPAVQEVEFLDEGELEVMSKTKLLALAHERGIKATRRWTCFEIRQALLKSQTSEVEKKTSEV